MATILSRWNQQLKNQDAADFLMEESIWPTRSDWLLFSFYWLLAIPMIAIGYYQQSPWPVATGALIFNIIIDTLMVWMVV